MEKRLLVDFLGLRMVRDEHNLDILVLRPQEPDHPDDAAHNATVTRKNETPWWAAVGCLAAGDLCPSGGLATRYAGGSRHVQASLAVDRIALQVLR
jgi:hypothetical protein